MSIRKRPRRRRSAAPSRTASSPCRCSAGWPRTSCCARKACKMGVNYGFEKVRFLAPVRSGKRVRGRFKLLSLEEKRPASGSSSTSHRRDRGRGQARLDRRLDRHDLHLKSAEGSPIMSSPRSRHRLHRPHADRQGLSRRVQRHPLAHPRRPRDPRRGRARGRRSGRDRRRDHRRRAPAGRAGDDRPHRRACAPACPSPSPACRSTGNAPRA